LEFVVAEAEFEEFEEADLGVEWVSSDVLGMGCE